MKRPRRKPTIWSVSRLAGVSPQTVSNVLNNPDRVSPEKRGRVLKAIKRLGYEPNYHAQSLRRRRTNTIGFVYGDAAPKALTDALAPIVLAGVSDGARSRGYAVLVDVFDPIQAGGLSPRQLYAQQRFDGAIVWIVAPPPTRQAVLDDLAASAMPVLILEEPPQGSLPVFLRVDNFGGAVKAVEHLVERGHERIAFLGATERWAPVAARAEGYRHVLTRRGLPMSDTLLWPCDWTWTSAMEVCLSRLKEVPHPTAIFAGNDELALGAISAARQLGLKVPGDVAMLGFDDLVFAPCMEPPLTTVRYPAYEFGLQAVEVLIRFLNGEIVQKDLVLPTELVIRGSA